MKRPKLLVCLPTDDNDYQCLQATDAQQIAELVDVDIDVIYADNSAVEQSVKLAKIVQSNAGERPSAIIVEPVGTGMVQVAKRATSGMGWALLNRHVDYIGDLRKQSALVFAVSTDHEGIGQIQGRQIATLLPNGGVVLCIEGPGEAAQKRTEGMRAMLPSNVQVRTVRGEWTEESACRAVGAWLALSISQELPIGLIAAQDDSMAMGARRAIRERVPSAQRDRWLRLPFLGCDGLPQTGQRWVDKGELAATVISPSSAGLAVRLMAQAVRTRVSIPEYTFTTPNSYPSLEKLSPRRV
jgi:ribose transport system substrate-binding protein